MQIIDSHCHIHDPEFADKYDISVEQIIAEAAAEGVMQYICVGTSATSSSLAVAFADTHKGAYASLAVHPHEAELLTPKKLASEIQVVRTLAQQKHAKVVAIGECGLDYYYHESQKVRDRQKALFRQHIDIAIQADLPLIFHIRSAFEDFFKILDEYKDQGHKIQGVVHSFTAGTAELKGCIDRGLYIGLNGIMTFTKDQSQLDAAKAAPLDKILLETDAPFLTPKPFRGKMCELKHVVLTAQFLSELRGESLQVLAAATTANTLNLFRL